MNNDQSTPGKIEFPLGFILPPERVAQMRNAVDIMNATLAVSMRLAVELRAAYPRKRIFRKIDRRPKKRMMKAAARVRPLITAAFAATNVSAIMATPTVPDYPPGGGIIYPTNSLE